VMEDPTEVGRRILENALRPKSTDEPPQGQGLGRAKPPPNPLEPEAA